MKRQATYLEKILPKDVSSKELLFKIYQELSKRNNKPTEYQHPDWALMWTMGLESGQCGNSLYLLLNFAVKLNLL